MENYKRGLTAGIPIALGYLSVSFTFGIMAVSYGLSWWQAVLISMTTVTSAGQFAGIGIMMHPGQYFQMLISQITINIRYSFMSISVGQKADSGFSGISRWILGFMMTDEIFAVASQEDSVSRSFFAGLSTLPYIGWAVDYSTVQNNRLIHILYHFLHKWICNPVIFIIIFKIRCRIIYCFFHISIKYIQHTKSTPPVRLALNEFHLTTIQMYFPKPR